MEHQVKHTYATCLRFCPNTQPEVPTREGAKEEEACSLSCEADSGGSVSLESMTWLVLLQTSW